ncbi:hypothetical protein ABPG74_009679 [Tetrahymena malaccensis]
MNYEDLEKNVKIFESEMVRKNMKAFTKIDEVEVNYLNDKRVSPKMIDEITIDLVKQSPTMLHLFQNIINSLKRFEQSGMYKQVEVELLPGSKKDSVLVQYRFKPSSFYFANISHQFDRFGQASMTSKLGFRNVLGLFDKLTFEYNKALNKSKRSYYNIQWNVPYNFLKSKAEDNFLAQISHSSTLLDQSCSETKDSCQIIYTNIDNKNEQEKYSLSFESAYRRNYVTLPLYRNLEDFLPTTKHSIRYATSAFSTIKMGSNVHKGSSLNYSLELGLPLLSDVVFLKTEANYKSYWKLKALKKVSDMFKHLNIEYSGNLGLVKTLNNDKLHLNECFSLSTIRGVNDINVDYIPQGDQQINQQQSPYNLSSFLKDNLNLQLKSSIKLNLYNFPGTSKSGVIPFYHASAGYFYRVRNGQGGYPLKSFSKYDIAEHLKHHFRASAGIGVGLSMGPSTKVELLYNYFQFSRLSDNRANIELRISVDD